jgi:ABC-type multidrug transport system ATPase subunit
MEACAATQGEVLKVAIEEASYRGQRVLSRLAFRLLPGETATVRGANGGGKSTLVAVLAGAKPFRGAVLVDGVDLARHPNRAKRRLSVAFQDVSVDSSRTARAALGFHERIFGAPRDAWRGVADALGLTELDKPIAALSGGTKKKVELVKCLCASVPLYVLDEPFESLDEASRRALGVLLAERRAAGAGLLVVAHGELPPALRPDHAFVLERGRIRAMLSGEEGPPTESVQIRFVGWSNDLLDSLRAVPGVVGVALRPLDTSQMAQALERSGFAVPPGMNVQVVDASAMSPAALEGLRALGAQTSLSGLRVERVMDVNITSRSVLGEVLETFRRVGLEVLAMTWVTD